MPKAITFELRVRRSDAPNADGIALTELRVQGAGGAPSTASLAGPETVSVEGEQRSLDRCLSWYLEDFLRVPFDLDVIRAQRIVAARDQWGRAAFDAVFGTPQGLALYTLAQHEGPGNTSLRIESNDPAILAWPWEAMHADHGEKLGVAWRIGRQLSRGDAAPAWDPIDIHTPRLEVLLVTARPGGQRDVGYRSISRPLVDLARKDSGPVQVELLRPPTFAALEEHLNKNKGRYHVLHFDGHGTYGAPGPSGAAPSPPSRHYLSTLDARRGFLQFEPDEADPDTRGLVSAERFGALLDRHRIPIVVLNACRSAMTDERAADEFASVAASLSKAGVRSVVAMSHNLWVSGAQQFIPGFYRSLLDTGDVGEAVREGRQRMKDTQGRVCSRGRWNLEDWTVPRLFQQNAPTVVLRPAAAGAPAEESQRITQQSMPQDARISDAPFGFVGRDGPILELERAIRRRAAVVIHGIGGVGKSTLVRGFLEWLADTGGLRVPPLWFGLDGIADVEYILNRIGEAFGVENIGVLPLESPTQHGGEPSYPKVEVLRQLFSQLETPVVCVLDNFEVLTDSGAGEATGRFKDSDRGCMRELIRNAHGTPFRIIITSRSDERWLGEDYRALIDLPGLDEEERWEFVDAVVKTLGLQLDRNDADLKDLLDDLGGHPLLMRVVLPRLGRGMSAAQARQHLGRGVVVTARQGDDRDETLEKLRATLKFATDGLPIELRPPLALVAMHERYVDSYTLGIMATQVDPTWNEATVQRFVDALTHGGLVRQIQGITSHGVLLELHPALAGHLRSTWLPALTEEQRDRWIRAFLAVMGWLANAIAPKPVFEQRAYHTIHGANFNAALAYARRLGATQYDNALTQSLAIYAENTRNFDTAVRLYGELIESWRIAGDEGGLASGYHQLGLVAQERRDFDVAEAWYKKALEIEERLNNERGAAITYHQLGRVAQERHDIVAAEAWYKKSLEIEERLNNEHGAAISYHQLGVVAQERRDFDAAETWYKKALEIKERLNDEHGASNTYGQLGIVAQERRDFDAAEAWYKRALAIEQRLGDEHGAAIACHQLGMVAQERRDFDAAEAWYKESLEIEERLGNKHGAASTYHHLGMMAQERRDFDAAEAWYKKSLEIKERLNNKHGAAITYHQLGMVAEERRDVDAAEAWYTKSLEIKEQLNDEHGEASTYHQLGTVALGRCDFDAAEAWYKKSLEIEERLDDEYGAATTYHQLGVVAHSRRDFVAAEAWYTKALEIKERLKDEYGAASTYGQLGNLERDCGNYAAAIQFLIQAAARFMATDAHDLVAQAVYGIVRSVQAAPQPERPALLKLATDAGIQREVLDKFMQMLDVPKT